MHSQAPSSNAVRSPREIIDQKIQDEIEVYINGRGKTRIHEGARNLSLNVSDDYGNRFLVELIQNAHDAHAPGTSDGKIAVVFAPDEEEFGCLYVANGGNGFSEENFLAITNIALSSKPVNENIGNKGLGFRSVLQICQWPEVYSSNGSGGLGEFDGYCFRFANTDDVTNFLPEPNAQDLAVEIIENMPCWYLPVFATTRPGLVDSFSQEGFATVVRMPLVSAEARELVKEQLDDLLSREHPLHLFLERIASISIERAPGKIDMLERIVRDQWLLPSGIVVRRLKVGEDDYLVASYELQDGEFHEQLNESLARKEVPESWKNWKGSASVSIAIRMANSVKNGLLYCFLPLGDDGQAPLAGYINANFYTKMDRRSVNESIGLNRYFIEKTAFISSYVIDFLIEKNWADSPGAVIDLLCWKKPYDDVIRAALSNKADHLIERPLLPTLSTGGETHWSSVRNTFIWDALPESCLSVDAVIRVAGADILHQCLSERQRSALESFFGTNNETFDPTPAVIAGWIEKIAVELHGAAAAPERWASFYDEVTSRMRHSPRELFGRKFLLSVTGKLIAAESSEGKSRRRLAADIYFPPVITLDADSDDDEARRQLPLERFPANLKKGFALLNRDVPWTLDEGGYRAARAFFLEAKLVREYDTRDVIRTLARITVKDDEPIKLQALEWAFRLWSSGRSLSHKETRGAGIFVPTREGWRSAEAAMFGNGWSSCSNGRKLEALIKASSCYSFEMVSQQECLLPPFSEWLVDFGKEDDWVQFLRAAGVREHLRPISGEELIQQEGTRQNLPNMLTNSVSGLSDDAKLLWRQELIEQAKDVRFISRDYRSDLRAWRLPGQCDAESFDDETRKAYAIQVILAIGDLSDEHLKFRVYRPKNPSTGTDRRLWRTPLACLLRDLHWMPISRRGGSVRYVKPCDAWHFNTEDESLPRFMETVVQPVAKLFDEGRMARLRELLGLRTLNDPADALQALNEYENIAAEGLSDARDVKRFSELFGAVWEQVAPMNEGVSLENIPVFVGGRIETLNIERVDEEDHPVAYFIDDEDAPKRRLFEELEQPIFDFGRINPDDTWGWFEVLAPGRFVKLSDEQLNVLIDGHRVSSSIQASLITEVLGSWFVDFVICVAVEKGGKFFRATHNTLSKIRRAAMSLRIITGRNLQISMSGEIRELPESLRGSVVIWSDQEAVLVVQSEEKIPDIRLLATVSEQLAVALQYPVLASPLEAAFLSLLQNSNGAGDEVLDDDTIANALGTSALKIREARLYAREDLSAHIRFARLLVICLGFRDANTRLAQLSEVDIPAEEDMREALSPVCDGIGMSIDELVNRLGVVLEPRDLISTFGIPLVTLNAAIEQLEYFKPISNEILHRQQLDAYLTQHNDQIVEQIRLGYLETFDSYESLDDYVQVRDAVMTIKPNSDWFQHFEEVPEETLKDHVSEWLKLQGVKAQLDTLHCIPALRHCRDENTKRLRSFWQKFGPVIATWVRYSENQVTALLREVWNDPKVKRQEYAVCASKDGWLDFQLLDDLAIAARLKGYGVWPEDKPVSTDLADWGIDEITVHENQVKLENEREIKRRRRLQIILDGNELSALEENYDKLASVISTNLDNTDAFKNIESGMAELADIEPSKGRSENNNRRIRRVKRSADTAMSDEQRAAVGLIGELYAREWIKRYHRNRHGLEVDDNCWVSEYRNAVLGTDTGNDMLGYDLIVKLKSVTYYYEVKASQGDACVFEMGPTEIAAAQRFQLDKTHKYRVLYISHATDSKNVQIELLPNPFSKNGVKKLCPIGSGSVTFKFNPK